MCVCVCVLCGMGKTRRESGHCVIGHDVCQLLTNLKELFLFAINGNDLRISTGVVASSTTLDVKCLLYAANRPQQVVSVVTDKPMQRSYVL